MVRISHMRFLLVEYVILHNSLDPHVLLMLGKSKDREKRKRREKRKALPEEFLKSSRPTYKSIILCVPVLFLVSFHLTSPKENIADEF